MTAETTVLHGRLPSAHGNTASPTPRSGDHTLDSASVLSSSRHRRDRDRDSRREKDKDDASRRGHSSSSSSFAYRDIIKSVLSHVMTKAETPSSSSPSPSQDMKHKQVEDVVRGLAMEEWNSRWLDELVAKVKGELNDGADHADDASVSDNTSPSPSEESSSKESMKRYQPTVEDYNEDEDEPSDFEYGFTPTVSVSIDDTQPLTRTSSQLSSSSQDSSSSSSSKDSSKDSLPTPPSSVSSDSPTPRPTVRFQPPVIHYITEPPEPEPEPEPELHRTHSLPTHLRSPAPERQEPSWTLLFNERDEPTPALGRFLRGLANHIIAEYSPTDSLVITPDKLLKFYSRYKLDNEFFPFQRVFDTRYHKSLRGISFLFSDLRCEHHLVQPSIDSKPSIPALTPAGFEDWMTLMVRAFPDREAKRLDLVLADMPLLADDRHARLPPAQRLLPRELPRELFPERGHPRVFDLLASSFAEWNTITAVIVPPEAVAASSSSSSSAAASSSSHPPLHAYVPSSLHQLPPAASKALKEDTRRHKDACYIDQTRLRPSSLIYPSSPASPTSSFSTVSSAAPPDAKPEPSSSSSSSGSSSSSKHRSSRSRDRESRHRSERSSRRSERERSPRRHHKSRRYRDSSPSDYTSGRSDERRRERERRGSN
ncbi:uncharacterized protein Triagg1_3500 [Trichoderma aggressivum f. europaeum]|uniref:DUF7514 domain-containing protein n=1 Tax=Trichoderma aggressivum f. europaeum TaxID=173218 RepID=A0AAE1M251_9HYPO|nr:hypothetical protein Triagg1_3500 [Trichoderma aggressivum f. europaeum]